MLVPLKEIKRILFKKIRTGARSGSNKVTQNLSLNSDRPIIIRANPVQGGMHGYFNIRAKSDRTVLI